MSGCLKIVALGLLAILALGFIGGLSQEGSVNDYSYGSQTSVISQKGFFQDNRRNRVFALEMPSGTTAEQAHAHAGSLPYTHGQVTSAYYYKSGSHMPIDGITLARDFLAATEVLDTPGLSRFAYAYVRGFNGQAKFADCEANPEEDICVSVRE